MPNWIKLHDSLLDSDVFCNEKTLKLWIWLLIKANWKSKTKSVSLGKGSLSLNLKRGQLLFGRNSAENQLDMNGSTIYRHLKKLEELGNIKVESNNHYSVVTICKYDIYQRFIDEDEQPMNSQQAADELPMNSKRTANEQPMNTSIESLDSIESNSIIIHEPKKKEKMISNEIKKCLTSIYGIGDIEIGILQCGEDWWLLEIEKFVTQSQERFIQLSNTKPLLKKPKNLEIIIQEFVNHILAGGAIPQQANQIRNHFKNWVVKQNGTLETLVKEKLALPKTPNSSYGVISNKEQATEFLKKQEESKGGGISKEERLKIQQQLKMNKK